MGGAGNEGGPSQSRRVAPPQLALLAPALASKRAARGPYRGSATGAACSSPSPTRGGALSTDTDRATPADRAGSTSSFVLPPPRGRAPSTGSAHIPLKPDGPTASGPAGLWGRKSLFVWGSGPAGRSPSPYVRRALHGDRLSSSTAAMSPLERPRETHGRSTPSATRKGT